MTSPSLRPAGGSWGAGHNFRNQSALIAFQGERLGKSGRDVLDANAEISANDLACLHEAVSDLRNDVGGHSEAHALEAAAAAENRGVDANQSAIDVDERATGVAGIDRGVGLDEVLIALDVGKDPDWRPFALTMPLVTVSPIPKGLPMASTRSPTSIFDVSANVTAGRLSASTLMTAMSVCGSRPTTLAVNSRPSVSVTVTCRRLRPRGCSWRCSRRR